MGLQTLGFRLSLRSHFLEMSYTLNEADAQHLNGIINRGRYTSKNGAATLLSWRSSLAQKALRQGVVSSVVMALLEASCLEQLKHGAIGDAKNEMQAELIASLKCADVSVGQVASAGGSCAFCIADMVKAKERREAASRSIRRCRTRRRRRGSPSQSSSVAVDVDAIFAEWGAPGEAVVDNAPGQTCKKRPHATLPLPEGLVRVGKPRQPITPSLPGVPTVYRGRWSPLRGSRGDKPPWRK